MNDKHAESAVLSRIDQQKAAKFNWGSIQWLVNREMNKNCEMTFGHVVIMPGEKNVLHVHPNCDEVLWLIEGELDHSLGDESFRITPGMAIFIPRNAPHDAINKGAVPARMIVAYSSGDRQTIMLEEGEEA